MAPKFSLQNVLEIRHGKVELLEIELGKLLSARQETEALLLSLHERQILLLEQLSQAQTGEIDLFKIESFRSNILRVNQRMDEVTAELARQEQAITNKRADLIKARQDEETLEILKKKRYEIYQAEQVQIEARAQDDIYIARAFRNQRSGA